MIVFGADIIGVSLRVVGCIALAVIVTLASLRLLGIRRGWGTALLAGLIGWGVAVVVSLGLTGWDWGSDGLVVHLIAVGIPSTMAVAVGLDLLARPGSLATGERAGLVVAPRPISAVRTRLSVLRRYRELAQLARQEGIGPFQRRNERIERTPLAEAARLRRVLEQAGGVYVKLGQIAATRVDLLPAEVCAELSELQNRVPPEPREAIAAVLEAELGDLDTVFADFEWEPLAAASIGQTHRATLRTGEHVVVKIQRPGIAETMERDLAALRLLAEFVQRRTPFGRDVRSGDLLGQFAVSLRAELDFRREAEAMIEMSARLDGVVRVPVVHQRLCTRRVLVQERFEGATVGDLAGTGSGAGVDRADLADRLLRSTIDQVMRLGYFHADPHPGNVFALDDGSLGLIDFGATGRLDPIQQKAVIDIFFAMSRRDVVLLREGVERIADLDEATSADALERALSRMLADHVRPGGTIQPQVMQELVAVLARFGLRLPADIVLLSRALVTLDGTLRVLCPELSLMTATMELIQSPSAAPILDGKEMVRDELMSMLPHLRRLPERVDRLLAVTGRGELRIRTVTDEDSRRIVRTLVNRALLGVLGAAVLAVSALLLVAADPGPLIAERTGLFEVFGYGGLLAGAVLVLRVVDAIARDGTT